MFKVQAERRPWSTDIEILLMERREDGTKSVALPSVFVEREPGHAVQPTWTLSHQAAQDLMDELWRAGLRPTEGRGSAGSLKATQDHLQDMREIAFSFIPKRKNKGGHGTP